MRATRKMQLMAAALCAGLGAAGAAQAAKGYIYDVAPGQGCEPSAINASGQITGRISGANYSWKAFYTGGNGVGLTVLSPSSPYDSAASADINASGAMVGWQLDMQSSLESEGMVISAAGVSKPLHAPRAGQSADVRAINDAGVMVGNFYFSGDRFYTYDAFIQRPGDAAPTVLPKVLGQYSLEALDINASGQILARVLMDDETGDKEYVVMNADASEVHRVLMPDGTPVGWANSINDAGVVSGGHLGGDKAFLANPVTGTFVTVDAPKGTSSPVLLASNSKGHAVGWATGPAPNYNEVAVAKRASGPLQRLAPSISNLPAGTKLVQVIDINDRNQMAVLGWRNGNYRDKACYIVCPTENCK